MLVSRSSRLRDLGRIAPDAGIDMLAPTLIGAASQLFTERKDSPPDPEAVRKIASTVLAAACQ